MLSDNSAPIGVFDSGYGGLSVLRDLIKILPKYDYIYLGDNARNPYGTRSFETVYNYTLQAVNWLFSQGCHLVILACNTASAKALRTIQQNNLPAIDNKRRVLGVIRPSVEAIKQYTTSNFVGILGTIGTVKSNSYVLELKKLFPEIVTYQQACPMWVPLVENNEFNNAGADYFVKKDIDKLLSQNKKIDTIILGCTHYPLLIDKIKKFLPDHINLISQGEIVAKSLEDYLFRHPEMEEKCLKSGHLAFYTTDSPAIFAEQGRIFLNTNYEINARHIDLG